MTRKEKIINVLKTTPNYRRNEKGKIELNYDKIADEILAIPLDVPTDEEIEKWTVLKYSNVKFFPELTVFLSAKWVIEEIIKRNQK